MYRVKSTDLIKKKTQTNWFTCNRTRMPSFCPLVLVLRRGGFRVFSTGYFKTEYVTPVVFYPE
jgi:hypothetical protein